MQLSAFQGSTGDTGPVGPPGATGPRVSIGRILFLRSLFAVLIWVISCIYTDIIRKLGKQAV